MLYNRVRRSISVGITMILIVSLCACKPIEIDVHIFSNIEECRTIINSRTNNANVEIYDSPAIDKHLKGLPYQDWFGCKYISDEFDFEIFAYEFSNSDVAMEYFKNVTGKENDPNPTFLESSGLRNYHRVVIFENIAYIIHCTNSDKDDVIAFVNSCFSVVTA